MEIAIIFDKVEFRGKKITAHKEQYYVMKKGLFARKT